ncbi:MAG: hypothetical protein ACN6PJ_16605 [Achromobacter sp.]|uniref:hypothetical protein n=1 Tax=Achromobacter sp. TaxID=134375 RepID=UPI003CFBE6A1
MSKLIEKQLESIHQELKGNELDPYLGRGRSLNYYIRDIHQKIEEWFRLQRQEKEKRAYELTWALVLIGTIGVLLAINRSDSSDWNWVRENTLTFRLCAVILCTMFVGVTLERSTVIRSLWSFTVTKFLVSIILSGLVLYARGKAAGHINEIFHVDASALPITLVFTTALLVLKLLVPFILAIALLLSLVHILISLVWLKDRLNGEVAQLIPLYSLLSTLVSAVILYHGGNWSTDQLSDPRVPEKIYLMAYALDFSHSHECANVPKNRPVIFLGNAQDSVLIAPYKLVDFDFSDFFEASVDVPTNFIRQRCDYKVVPATEDLNYE